MLEMLKEFICPELVVLIPVLYLIGIGLKKTEFVRDKHIPLWLGIVAVGLSALYIGATSEFASSSDIFSAIFAAVTQGVLCAGASVYVNQLIKQEGKDE